jgi:hypothetical protein
VAVVTRRDLASCRRWASAFSGKRKDRRFYELVEDTLEQGFDHRYLVIADGHGEAVAVQPCFLLDQDLLAGISDDRRTLTDLIRRVWPRFLKIRTLMIGCAAGEGHLDGDRLSYSGNAAILARELVPQARDLKARLVVLKEFPAEYRKTLDCLLDQGFSRVPSLPMTRLDIGYSSFEEYAKRALNSATRRKLRKKFRATDAAPAIEMSVLRDVTAVVTEIYPLYLHVYERSRHRFERLTEAFFRRIGQTMPDTVRFFLWRLEGKLVAFTLCMVEGDALYAEYIGLDYRVALDLHLYHYAVRDMISWGIANGYKWLRSSGGNYDPKLHLRHKLDPVDLYVRHTSPLMNGLLRRILPVIEPTRYDPILKKFPNYDELWASS